METTKIYQDAAYKVIDNWIEDNETTNTCAKEMEEDIKSFMKKAMFCILSGDFEMNDKANEGLTSLFIVTLFGHINIYMCDKYIECGQFKYLIPLNYIRKYKEIFNTLQQLNNTQP
jgi:hypothetical protein